jgi:hypothetical protein
MVVSLTIGVLAGIMTTAYLLWPDSSSPPAQRTTGTVAPVKASAPAARESAKPKSGAPAAGREPAPSAAAQTPPAARAGAIKRQDDPKSRAAIEAEQMRLQVEAEQRLAERIREIGKAQATAGYPHNEPVAAPVGGQTILQPETPAEQQLPDGGASAAPAALPPASEQPDAGEATDIHADSPAPASTVPVTETASAPGGSMKTQATEQSNQSAPLAVDGTPVAPDDNEDLF